MDCQACSFNGRLKESKHEGIRYPCNQCEFASTKPGILKAHKKSKHEGIRYPCDECDYAAKDQKYLKRHKESKHSGIGTLVTNAIILPPTKPISRLIRNLNIKVSDTIVISVILQQPNQEFSRLIRNPSMKDFERNFPEYL